MIFYGLCPFLGCVDTDIHAHPECPDCGAVRYGNTFCATCVNTWTEISDESRAALLAAIAARKDTT